MVERSSHASTGIGYVNVRPDPLDLAGVPPRSYGSNAAASAAGLFAHSARFSHARFFWSRPSRMSIHNDRSRRTRGAVPPALGAMDAYGGEGPSVVSTLSVLGTAATCSWTSAKFMWLGGQLYLTYSGVSTIQRIGGQVEKGVENLVSHGLFAAERLTDKTTDILMDALTIVGLPSSAR